MPKAPVTHTCSKCHHKFALRVVLHEFSRCPHCGCRLFPKRAVVPKRSKKARR